jgi:hypothetical protein
VPLTCSHTEAEYAYWICVWKTNPASACEHLRVDLLGERNCRWESVPRLCERRRSWQKLLIKLYHHSKERERDGQTNFSTQLSSWLQSSEDKLAKYSIIHELLP